jgi:MoxR-like ATPase
VVVGQEAVLDLVLVALGVGGHVLLEGVPGTAKTLLANATARALGLDVAIEADVHSIDGLVDALCAWATDHPRVDLGPGGPA